MGKTAIYAEQDEHLPDAEQIQPVFSAFLRLTYRRSVKIPRVLRLKYLEYKDVF